jgi:cell division protein FtsL
MAELSYANHRKFVPGYHYVIFGILLINLILTVVRLFAPIPGTPVFDRIVNIAVAVTLMLIALYARTFPLRAQDRIIRLEERARLERLLPADLKGRIGELSTGQLIALRFASDGEVAELTRAALDQRLKNDDIKKQIREWRPDSLRM